MWMRLVLVSVCEEDIEVIQKVGLRCSGEIAT